MIEVPGRNQAFPLPADTMRAILLDRIRRLPRLPVPYPDLNSASLSESAPVEAFGPIIPALAQAETVPPHWLAPTVVACFAARCFGASVDPSLQTAAIAESLCNYSRRPTLRAEAVAAALLSDLGHVALRSWVPKTYARIQADADARREPPIEFERSRLGIDYAEMGAKILSHWRLPGIITEAVQHHHTDIAGRDVTRIVKLAHRWSPAVSRTHRFAESWDNTGLCAALGLSPDEQQRVIDDAGRTDNVHALLCRAVREAARPRPQRRRAPLPYSPTPSTPIEPLSDRTSDAISRFTTRQTPGRSAGEVLDDITRCLQDAVRTDRVLAFTYDNARHLCHCTLSQGMRSEQSVFVPAPRNADPPPMPHQIESLLPDVVTLDTIASAASVADRFRGAFGTQKLSFLPIAVDGETRAGVLFVDPLSTQAGPADRRRLLAAAFGTALTLAERSTEADRAITEAVRQTQRTLETVDRRVREKTVSTVARLAAGAAHELNTPLAVISGRVQLLARQITDPAATDALELIRRQSHLCSEIVSELIDFASPQPPTPRLTVLKPWLSQLRDQWSDGSPLVASAVTISLADPDLTIWGDPAQLETVFDKLITNALEATADGTTCVQINSTSRSSDDTVVVSVEDNGCGMSAEVLEHACDPFYSHRLAGRGRGLGLSIAQRLVELNGGRLRIRSALGAGTTVLIDLPAREPSEH